MACKRPPISTVCRILLNSHRRAEVLSLLFISGIRIIWLSKPILLQILKIPSCDDLWLSSAWRSSLHWQMLMFMCYSATSV